jgi:antirestriction protein ArdC
MFDEVPGAAEDDDVYAPSEDNDSLSGQDDFPDEEAFERAAAHEVRVFLVTSGLGLVLS